MLDEKITKTKDLGQEEKKTELKRLNNWEIDGNIWSKTNSKRRNHLIQIWQTKVDALMNTKLWKTCANGSKKKKNTHKTRTYETGRMKKFMKELTFQRELIKRSRKKNKTRRWLVWMQNVRALNSVRSRWRLEYKTKQQQQKIMRERNKSNKTTKWNQIRKKRK